MLKLLENFQKMDRRWVFLGMALMILIPLLFPFNIAFDEDNGDYRGEPDSCKRFAETARL